MRYSGNLFRIEGLLVALIYFSITRLVVAEAIRFQSGIAYLLSGLLPLAIGLGLTAFGVALAVGSYSNSYVRSVAIWCTLGTATMAGVLAISSFESLLLGAGLALVDDNLILVANILLAGATGGVVIGHRTAANLRQRDANKRQANRALLLNRLLRHEVINAVTIIRGYIQLLPNTDPTTAIEPITDASDRITNTIDEVAELIEEAADVDRIDLAQLVSSEVGNLEADYPSVEIRYRGPASGVIVSGDRRLSRVIEEFIEFSSKDSETSSITVALKVADGPPRLELTDDGNKLSEDRERLLTSGEFPRYDDPSSDFSLPTIRLLIREFGGQISILNESRDGGKHISIRLPMPENPEISRAINVSRVQLVWAVLTGILAGAVMGGYLMATTDLFPIIGVLYGAKHSLVGWTTHLFHSVIFTLIFAAAHTHPRFERYSSSPRRVMLTGIGWGLVLWLFAAGLVMPLWLTLVGIPAELPNLPTLGLVSHVIWGSVIGITYPWIKWVDLSWNRHITSSVDSIDS